MVDGVVPFLRGVRGLMNYRDFLQRPPMAALETPAATTRKWGDRLAIIGSLDEAESLALLGDFGIKINPTVVLEPGDPLLASANRVGYPLVLKTAMPGIQHKSEHDGVVLNILDDTQLFDCYAEMANRIGPLVLLAPMVGDGVEMILGARYDPQFGPVVTFGLGGVLAEVIGDVVFALPPFDAAYARRRLNELKLEALLKGVRGRPAANIGAFCDMTARVSAMVDALRDDLQEVDVNPVIVGPKESIAVDALIIGRANRKVKENEHRDIGK